MLYSPEECVEGVFSELRPYGVLGGPPPRGYLEGAGPPETATLKAALLGMRPPSSL
jgi:hypothetical protein